jgi:hypothetical protein
MPLDKETQMSLGLNHGLPNWYRRAYTVNVNSPPPHALTGLPQPPARNRLEGPWRQLELAQATEGYVCPGSGMQSPTRKLSHNPTFNSIANDYLQQIDIKDTAPSPLQLLNHLSPITLTLLSRLRSKRMRRRRRNSLGAVEELLNLVKLETNIR